jgi:hypothetical protein
MGSFSFEPLLARNFFANFGAARAAGLLIDY